LCTCLPRRWNNFARNCRYSGSGSGCRSLCPISSTQNEDFRTKTGASLRLQWPKLRI
ncbi:uncharacterized protein METZ01_LOCUS505931, partial [marine metagenome]